MPITECRKTARASQTEQCDDWQRYQRSELRWLNNLSAYMLSVVGGEIVSKKVGMITQIHPDYLWKLYLSPLLRNQVDI